MFKTLLHSRLAVEHSGLAVEKPHPSRKLGTFRLGLALTLFAAGTVQAATELKAPVKMLMKGHNRVAALKAIAKNPDSKIAFETLQTFYGDSNPKVTLRLDETTYEAVELDTTYVVAFSDVRRNFRIRELRERDPEGFRLLTILGGGPALLDDSPAVRLLFQAEKAEEPPSAADRLAAALTALASDNNRTRAFGALELSFRPEWIELMSPDQVASLRSFLREPSFGPNLHNRLFEVATQLPGDLQGPWLADEARRTLRGIESQFDLTTFFPRLASTAIRILGSSGGPLDSPLIGRFLESNNPGVVEAALESLDGLDPTKARLRAAAVLKRNGLHAESRRILTEYLG